MIFVNYEIFLFYSTYVVIVILRFYVCIKREIEFVVGCLMCNVIIKEVVAKSMLEKHRRFTYYVIGCGNRIFTRGQTTRQYSTKL